MDTDQGRAAGYARFNAGLNAGLEGELYAGRAAELDARLDARLINCNGCCAGLGGSCARGSKVGLGTRRLETFGLIIY